MANYLKDNEVEQITINFVDKTITAKLHNDEFNHTIVEKFSLSSAGGLAARTVKKLLVNQINQSRW